MVNRSRRAVFYQTQIGEPRPSGQSMAQSKVGMADAEASIGSVRPIFHLECKETGSSSCLLNSAERDRTTGPIGAMGASPNDNIYAVSGVDPNGEARNVFVWYHDRLANKYILLGSGGIVGSGGSFVPPGIIEGAIQSYFSSTRRIFDRRYSRQ